MRQLIGIILCATIPLLTFVGCGENETKSVTPNTSEVQNATVEPTIPTEPEMFDITTANFSDGFVRVNLEGTKGTDKVACIDSSGEIQYFVGEAFTKTVNFTNETYNNGSEIIDENGKTIFSIDETHDQILGYGGGYYAIAKHISNISTDKYLICFMDTDGNWCETEWDLSLSSVHPIDMHYRGEGFFEYKKDTENVFINPKENKSFVIDSMVIDGSFNILGEFQNGFAVINTNGTSISPKLLTTNGEIIETNLKPDYTTWGGNSAVTNGGFLFTTSSRSLGNHNILNFYDINTHSSHIICSYDENIRITNTQSLYFDNDKLFINLEGVDTKDYFTFINNKGEQLFEPIKCDKIHNYSCDRIVTELDGKYIIYNGKGEKIFETSRYELISSYNNDIAIASVYSNRHEFIDKDGNVLFKEGLTYNGDIYKLREIK